MMKIMQRLAASSMVLVAAVTWLSAAPTTQGKDKALERLQLAASEHLRILNDVASKLPEQARADLTPAMDAANKGLQAAQAAGGKQASTGVTAEADEAGKPDVTGVEHARAQVEAAFSRSQAVLQEVMTKVPPQAAAKIQEALTRIEANHARTIANLDRVMASERPEKPMRPERAQRPERPERAERPARPERPERPEHPRP